VGFPGFVVREDQLIRKGALVPGLGASTPLVVVSRSGIDRAARKLTVAISSTELVSATGLSEPVLRPRPCAPSLAGRVGRLAVQRAVEARF
jgi:hypothetical protein